MRNKKAKLIRRELRAETKRLYRLKPWYCPVWVWHRITGKIGVQPFVK